MSSGVKIEWADNWEDLVREAAADGINEIAKSYQGMFDRLGRQYRGRPVAEIKPVLQREWAAQGGSLTDPELTTYAEHISHGTRIEMRVQS